MLLTRKNPRGGKALSSFPYAEDPETGVTGIKLGYCGKCPSCGKLSDEPVILKIVDATEFANEYAEYVLNYRQQIRRLLRMRPQLNIKKRLGIWLLGGKREFEEFKEEYELRG